MHMTTSMMDKWTKMEYQEYMFLRYPETEDRTVFFAFRIEKMLSEGWSLSLVREDKDGTREVFRCRCVTEDRAKEIADALKNSTLTEVN